MHDEIKAALLGAIFGGLISAIIAILDASREKAHNRRDFCFRLYELWASDHMRKCRSDAWEYLESHSKDNAIDFIEMEKTHRDIWKELGSIEHFLADLSHFIDTKVVDKNLACRVFKEQAGSWLTHLLNRNSKRSYSQGPLKAAHTALSKRWRIQV